MTFDGTDDVKETQDLLPDNEEHFACFSLHFTVGKKILEKKTLAVVLPRCVRNLRSPMMVITFAFQLLSRFVSADTRSIHQKQIEQGKLDANLLLDETVSSYDAISSNSPLL